MTFIRVAVPVPTLDLLTYRVPDAGRAPTLGARAVVPLGSRTVTGIVVDVDVPAADIDEADIKPVRQLLDEGSFVPADIVALAQWTAEYYAAGPGETITAVLPPKARDDRADAHKTRRIATITAAGFDGLTLAQADGRHLGIDKSTPRHHTLVERLGRLGEYVVRDEPAF